MRFVVRSIPLTILFGYIATSFAMARPALFRGTAAVHNRVSGLNHNEVIKPTVAVVLDTSNDRVMRFGYKAVFPDGNEEKLALELLGDDIDRKARIVVHSGDHLREDGFAGALGTWSDVEAYYNADDGFRADFKREDGSTWGISARERRSTSTMDAVPDTMLTVTVDDYPAPGDDLRLFFKWEIRSQLDFNALMRVDDTSAEALLEELFVNQDRVN